MSCHARTTLVGGGLTGGPTGIYWALLGTGHLVTSEQAGRQSEQSAG